MPTGAFVETSAIEREASDKAASAHSHPSKRRVALRPPARNDSVSMAAVASSQGARFGEQAGRRGSLRDAFGLPAGFRGGKPDVLGRRISCPTKRPRGHIGRSAARLEDRDGPFTPGPSRSIPARGAVISL